MAWYSSSWETPTVVGNADSGSSTVVATFDSISSLQAKQNYALNNTALKWLRDTNEVDGNPVEAVVTLTHTDPLDIGVLQRDKGMAYQFCQISYSHGHGVKCLRRSKKMSEDRFLEMTTMASCLFRAKHQLGRTIIRGITLQELQVSHLRTTRRCLFGILL